MILELLYLGAVLTDALITRKRIMAYGPRVEHNALIRTLQSKFGDTNAVLLGLLVPALVMLGILEMTHLKWVLAVLTGFRLNMAWTQLLSLKYEAAIRAAFYKSGQPSPGAV